MKFELTSETKEFFGATLFRIRALTSFGSVQTGDLGGWVEKAENLSQDGNAWVFGDAQVSGDARVYGNAQVSGDAQVYGNAWVFGDAQVSGDAQVYGNARVSGDAQVYGDVQVSGNAQKTPICVTGLHYSVTITDSEMRIGCELHSHAEWAAFDDERIAKMDGRAARKFWDEHKATLLALCKSHRASTTEDV